MKIVEIKKFSNGGHRNMNGKFNRIPDGWAVIPDDMETPNFPFGTVEAEEIDGVMTVTKWTPSEVPEIQEIEKPITIDERVTALENALLELVIGGAE